MPITKKFLTLYRITVVHRLMVLQIIIDMASDIFRHFWPHSMLYIQCLNRKSIVYHSLKQRQIKMVVLSQVVNCWVGLQLLMVTCIKDSYWK